MVWFSTAVALVLVRRLFERKDDTPLGFVSGWSRAAMVRAGYQACGICMRCLELRSTFTFDLLHPASSEATIS